MPAHQKTPCTPADIALQTIFIVIFHVVDFNFMIRSFSGTVDNEVNII